MEFLRKFGIQKLGNKTLLATLVAACISSNVAVAADTSKAFTINGKVYSVGDVYKENQGVFYELDKKKHDLVSDIADGKYLEEYWKKLAEQKKTDPTTARINYLKQFSKLSDAEIDATLLRFKDNQRLKELSKKEQRAQIKQYLEQTKRQEAVGSLLEKARESGKLVVDFPNPQEPIYDVPVVSSDHVKYGPKPSDIKPFACSGDDCAITVVEYSEYQCPFCVRVLPTVSRLMTEYKGRIRWIVRDFPLSFHDRAKPAAIAAQCAGQQNKYWEMYEELFKNQRSLTDKNFIKFGKKISIKDTAKYEKCLKNPGNLVAVIEKNFRSGEKIGVTGTPAFFVNGRRLSGALPYEDFKKVFEDELKKIKKSS